MEILRNVEAELISTNSVCFVSFLSVYKGVNWRQLFMAPNRIDQCPMKGEEWGGGGGGRGEECGLSIGRCEYGKEVARFMERR